MSNTYAIATESIVPIRKNMGESYEMTSQLLFGEPMEVLKTEAKWFYIASMIDQYEGWVDKKMVSMIDKKEFIHIKNQERNILANKTAKIRRFDRNYPQLIYPGSFIWNFDESESIFNLHEQKYQIEEPFYFGNEFDSLKEIALTYINAPYLWGGKTLAGIDCSGFIQVVFQQLNVYLPRDAKDQIKKGKNIDFLNDIQSGDLAFFQNEEGLINHVGMLLDSKNIIHASGRVRIDKFDQQGIYNTELNQYSHNLRLIKRIR